MDIYEVCELIGSIKAHMANGATHVDAEMLAYYERKRDEQKQEIVNSLANALTSAKVEGMKMATDRYKKVK